MIRTENPYIYKPGDQIRRDLADSAQGIDAAANQIVERKKADYAQVKEVYDGMAILAQDFNNHHAEFLNADVAEIEKMTAASIKTMGRMDYSKLGEVNDRIRKLKQMQNNSVNSVKSFETMVSRVNQNPAYMRNPTGIIRQAEQILRDPSILKSPLDLGQKLEDLYASDVNYAKVGKDRIINSITSTATVKNDTKTYIDENGDEIKATIETYPNVTRWNPVTHQVEQEMITLPNGTTVGALDALTKDVFKPEELKYVEEFAVGLDKANGASTEDYIKGIVSNIVASGVRSTERSRSKEVVEGDRVVLGLNKVKLEGATFTLSKQEEKFVAEMNALKTNAQATKDRVVISRSQLGLAASRSGIAQDRLELIYKDGGLSKDGEGNLVYNKEEDLGLARSIELKRTASPNSNPDRIDQLLEAKNGNVGVTDNGL